MAISAENCEDDLVNFSNGDGDLPGVSLFVNPLDSIQNSPTKQLPTRESTTFINKLVEVLFEAWKSAEVFHKLIADVSYVPLNKNRDKSLGEIKIEGMKLEGKAPELLKLAKTQQLDIPSYGPVDPSMKTVCYDAELNFQGKVKL